MRPELSALTVCPLCERGVAISNHAAAAMVFHADACGQDGHAPAGRDYHCGDGLLSYLCLPGGCRRVLPHPVLSHHDLPYTELGYCGHHNSAFGIVAQLLSDSVRQRDQSQERQGSLEQDTDLLQRFRR